MSREFKRDAVRIAQTSGLTMRQVASDLGVGLSTLNKWAKMVSNEVGPSDPDQNLLRENQRLRRQNRILKDLSWTRKQSVFEQKPFDPGDQMACEWLSRRMRQLLKKAPAGSTGQRDGSFEGISRRLETRRFSRPRVEAQGNLINVALGVDG